MQIAAFVVEPVMAVGGVLMPPRTYFPKIKQLLDRYGILLLVDDVVCAFGRLGHWFGSEMLGVEPDLIAIAKGLTSGYIPMSASLVGDRVWRRLAQHADEIGSLGHGFTTSGHPVAAAAALANMAVIEEKGLLDAAESSGCTMQAVLNQELKAHPLVKDIRGVGLLIGVELTADHVSSLRTQQPGTVAAGVASACLDLGLIVRASPERDVIAMAPPLIIGETEIAMVVERFKGALAVVQKL